MSEVAHTTRLLLAALCVTLATTRVCASPPSYLIPVIHEISLNTVLKTLSDIRVYNLTSSDLDGVVPKAVMSFHNGIELLVKKPNQIRYKSPAAKAPKTLRGELYTYHFYRWLGLDYVPPATLARLNQDHEPWLTVKSALRERNWSAGEYVSLHQLLWSRSVPLPTIFQSGSTVYADSLIALHLDDWELGYLLQWSDLIIADYISGETDRLVQYLSNQVNNPRFPKHERLVSNLAIDATGQLIVYDSERAFGDGYYIAQHNEQFLMFQEFFFNRLCFFNPPTLQRIKQISTYPSPASTFEAYVQQEDPKAMSMVQPFSESEKATFNHRMTEALNRIKLCLGKHTF